MSYNSGVIGLVVSNRPRATRSADLKLLARLLPELYSTQSYYHYKSSYYPVVEQATPLDAIPKMSHRRPMRQLNTRQKDQMTEQASDNGRAVRQRSVRQETTSLRQGHFLSICNIPQQRKYFSLLFPYFSLLNLFQ